jgi:membrane dipeptidase
MLHRVGVRSIGLTHNPRSWAADGNAEDRNGSGLTAFGVRLVEEMNRLGMLVDVSHINERGFWDVMEVTRRPVIASHSDCKAVCDHPRNLDDKQIVALANNGGVMGVTFVPGFIDAKAPTLERLLDHIDYAVQVAGADHVGIGSDFDGGGTALKDATAFPRITEGLLKRGYSEGDVKKILGENHLRVLKAAIG